MASIEQQLKALEKKLQKKIENSMQNEVADEVKRVQSNMVYKEVYSAYPRPQVYERRMNDGGLSDTDNMEHEVKKEGNGVSLTVKNTTKSNSSYLPGGKSSFEIAGVVERGHGYNGNVYDYPYYEDYTKPRPFIQATRDELESTKSHVNALKNGLTRNGVKVE